MVDRHRKPATVCLSVPTIYIYSLPLPPTTQYNPKNNDVYLSLRYAILLPISIF